MLRSFPLAMATTRINNSPVRRLLYLIDVVVIGLVYFALDAATNAIAFSSDFRIDIIASTVVKCVFFVFIWFWLRLRGDTIAAIGLKNPRNWLRSILFGVTAATVVFIAVYLLERSGFHRDLSAFAPFKGNLELTLYQLGGVIIGAGFGEEYLFRGFLFQRLAMLFGGSKLGWGIACVIQAALFGVAHAYQNPLGMLLTGSIGLTMGFVFLATGRNLWVPIIAHTLYDTARIFGFYLYGPPPW
jgi:membrane protease YdiL (CAAX protease family)